MKRLVFGIIVVVVVLLIALAKVDFFKPTPVQPVCNSPYIHFENDCCLDVNENSICDGQEELAMKVEKAELGIKDEPAKTEMLPPFDAAEASEQILALADDFMTYLETADYHSLYFLFSSEFQKNVGIDYFTYVFKNLPHIKDIDSIYTSSLTVRRDSATLTFDGEGSAFLTESFGHAVLSYDDYYGWRFDDFGNYFTFTPDNFCNTFSPTPEQCTFNYAVLMDNSAVCATLPTMKAKCYYKLALKMEDAGLCHKSGDYQQSCLSALDISLSVDQKIKFCENDFRCIVNLAISEKDYAVCDSFADSDSTYRCYGELAYFLDDKRKCELLGAKGTGAGKEAYLCFIPWIAELTTSSYGDGSLCNRFEPTYQVKCMTDVITHKYQDRNFIGRAYHSGIPPEGTKTGKGSGLYWYTIRRGTLLK